jgi:hypothetical protein
MMPLLRSRIGADAERASALTSWRSVRVCSGGYYMSDKKEVTEAAKDFQEKEKGGADSSKQFSEAAHDQRDDSGAREDGGKAETDKPAPDWAESKTEGGTNLFPEGKGPGGS